MPGFVAAELVEPLAYDFTGTKEDGSKLAGWPKELANVKGVIPEPSDQSIGVFLEELKGVYKKGREAGLEGMDLGDDPSAADVLAAIDQVTGDDFVTLMTDVCAVHAKLCGGRPTARQIQMLPLRARISFFTWIAEEVVRPEGSSSGGGAPVIPLRTEATG